MNTTDSTIHSTAPYSQQSGICVYIYFYVLYFNYTALSSLKPTLPNSKSLCLLHAFFSGFSWSAGWTMMKATRIPLTMISIWILLSVWRIFHPKMAHIQPQRKPFCYILLVMSVLGDEQIHQRLCWDHIVVAISLLATKRFIPPGK